MKVKSIIFIAVTAIPVFLIVFAIYNLNDNPTGKGFVRKFKKHSLNIINITELNNSTFNFATNTSDNSIFKTYRDELKLFVIAPPYNEIKESLISIPKSIPRIYKGLDYYSWSNKICITTNTGDIYFLSDTKPKKYTIPLYDVSQPVITSANSLVLRSTNISNKDKNLELDKVLLSDGGKVIKKFQFPKHVYGTFYNDGYLQYDNESSKIFYTYYYRGEFLCLDTNLNLLYKSKTIDTVSIPNIKLGVIKKKNPSGVDNQFITITSPPNIINRSLTTYKDFVYVLSRVNADNEQKSLLLGNTPVDVYSKEKGKYIYSFYIPLYKGAKPKYIRISSKTLTAIYRNDLITYEFNYENAL